METTIAQHQELLEKGERKFDEIIGQLVKMQRALWLIGGALLGNVPGVKEVLEKLIENAHGLM